MDCWLRRQGLLFSGLSVETLSWLIPAWVCSQTFSSKDSQFLLEINSDFKNQITKFLGVEGF
jgi:hypothetical protein